MMKAIRLRGGKNNRFATMERPFTDEELENIKELFLEDFSEYGIVLHACEKAGITRQEYTTLRERDEEFDKQFLMAYADSQDQIRWAIKKRALRGTKEYVVSNGRLVTDKDGRPLQQTRYSDQLLTTIAKTLPEFRDQKQAGVNITGDNIHVNIAEEDIEENPEAAAHARNLIQTLSKQNKG